ncbi:MAG: sulfatase-like hydrolase/transferase [Desulfobacterales bacterium]|nr:sulfatase-like hydrolase/transferase [Desulfobacterales bacterium]
MFYIGLFGVSLALLSSIGIFFRTLFLVCQSGVYTTLGWGEALFALFWGIRFDLAIAAIFSCSILLLAFFLSFFREKRWKILIPLPLAICTLCALLASDIMYFHDAGRHIGYELSDAATDFTSLVATAFTLYWPIALMGCGVAIVSLFLWGYLAHWAVGRKTYRLGWVKGGAASFLGILLSVVLIRGGVTGLPMSPLFAYKIGHTKMAEIALNGAYSGVYYLFKGGRKVRPVDLGPVESPQEEMARLKGFYGDKKEATDLSLSQMNVVVVLLESWPATLMKGYGFEHNVTPFFDSLSGRGISSKGMIAGGHRTTEGIFTTFCSYQNPLGQSLAKSQLSSNDYGSLAQILMDKGWETAFFQGSRKDTSGTGAFAQRLGFEKSFGKKDIPEADREYGVNKWGVFDQDIYRFVLKNLKEMKQPFLAGINTNTTHDGSLPQGVSPAFGMASEKEVRMSVLRFADDALKGFLEAYEADDAFGPTLFVLLADHTAGVTGSALAHYLIPFTLFSTDNTVSPLKIDGFVSQRDIAPTVIDLLGGHVGYFTGTSLLKAGKRRADYYHQGVLGWIDGDHLVEIYLLDGNRTQSYLLTGTLDGKREVSPDVKHKAMIKDALAFTRRSQALLFSGKTLEFKAGL